MGGKAMDGYKRETRVGAYAELGEAADRLRRSVFIEEQGVPEDEVFDGLNDQAAHVVVFEGGAPVATARVLRGDRGQWRIGLVAVDKSRRGRHLGVEAMQAALRHVSAHGGGEVALTAQKHAVGFYESLGFRQSGAEQPLESGFVLVPMQYQAEGAGSCC